MRFRLSRRTSLLTTLPAAKRRYYNTNKLIHLH
jgi:hypothetical protein